MLRGLVRPDRSPLIRIPASRGNSTRVELRSPTRPATRTLPSLQLAAGLDGIKNNLTPPPPVNRNIYKMTACEMDDCGITSLPANLYDALQLFKSSDLVRETLDDHITDTYYEFKIKEWNAFRTAVHPWEIEQYLTRY